MSQMVIVKNVSQSLLSGKCIFFFNAISEIIYSVFLATVLISSLCTYIPGIVVLHMLSFVSNREL